MLTREDVEGRENEALWMNVESKSWVAANSTIAIVRYSGCYMLDVDPSKSSTETKSSLKRHSQTSIYK